MVAQRQQGGRVSGSRLDRYREMTDWRATAIYGILAWVACLVLSALVLLIMGVTDEQLVDQGVFDLANWTLFEGMGGTVESIDSLVTPQLYAYLDTNWFGVGVILHLLVPAFVLCLAGYLLAGRHAQSGRTRKTVETVVAGSTLALPFALLMVIAMLVVDDEGVTIDAGELLVVSLLYPLVFASIGATIKSRGSLSSLRGFLGGIGAFLGALVLWFLTDDPFEDFATVDSFSELDGAQEQFEFLYGFLQTHGLEPGVFVPEWYVLVVPVVVGAAIAYTAGVTDPVAGMGKAASLGVGYVVAVAVVAIGYAGVTAREIADNVQNSWPDASITAVNLLVAGTPRTIIVAGIVYPVALGAVGGAIGATVYQSQHGGQPAPRETPPPRQQGSGRGTARQQGGPAGRQGSHPPQDGGGPQEGPQSAGQPRGAGSHQGQDGRQQGEAGGHQGQDGGQQGEAGGQQGQGREHPNRSPENAGNDGT